MKKKGFDKISLSSSKQYNYLYQGNWIRRYLTIFIVVDGSDFVRVRVKEKKIFQILFVSMTTSLSFSSMTETWRELSLAKKFP